jgi:hypothetical protein
MSEPARPARRSERGVSLVEAAIALPLVLLLALGVTDFGFMFMDSLDVSGAAREGARVGSAVGDQADADDYILGAVNEATAGLQNSTLRAIWIFKAGPHGEPVDKCVVDDSPGYYSCVGTTDNTNIYDESGSLLVGSWNADGRKSTIGSACPTNPGACPDRLGVRIVFSHDWVTGFFGLSDGPFTEDAVFQIEPGVD